jgi:hypothetical protein
MSYVVIGSYDTVGESQNNSLSPQQAADAAKAGASVLTAVMDAGNAVYTTGKTTFDAVTDAFATKAGNAPLTQKEIAKASSTSAKVAAMAAKQAAVDAAKAQAKAQAAAAAAMHGASGGIPTWMIAAGVVGLILVLKK